LGLLRHRPVAGLRTIPLRQGLRLGDLDLDLDLDLLRHLLVERERRPHFSRQRFVFGLRAWPRAQGVRLRDLDLDLDLGLLRQRPVAGLRTIPLRHGLRRLEEER
jgi:hypothetical protein